MLNSTIRQFFRSVVFLALLIITSLAFSGLTQLQQMQSVMSAVQAYLPLYLACLLLLKSISIIYPPLPGALFTLASVPLIGWQQAYLVDIAGSTIGALVAFGLGQRYGLAILQFALGERLLQKVLSVKLKPMNQVEAAFVLRLAAGGMLSDGLAWGASLMGFRLRPFMTGYMLSHLVSTLPVFYYFGLSTSSHSSLFLIGAALLAWLVVYLFKGRYFE